MATTTAVSSVEYPSSSASAVHKNCHLATTALGGRLPANIVAQMIECNMGPIVGGGGANGLYTSGDWTIVNGGTGDATATATATPGGGILVTHPSDDDFNMAFDYPAPIPAANMLTGLWAFMLCRVQVSHATQVGFRIGLQPGNAVQPLPFTTDYTDQICFSKAIASANVLGKVRGNSGTAMDTATLATCVAATELELGFWCQLSSGTSSGSWWVDGTEKAFSSDQLTALTDILTSPPAMFWGWNGTGTTGNTPTMTITSLIAGSSA